MKKYIKTLLLLSLSFMFAQQQTATYSFSPNPTFEGTDALTITINGSSINETTWGVTNNQLYAWVWALDSANAIISYSGNGSWNNSDASKLMTYNSANDTYSFTYNPNVFNFFGSTQVAKVGFLIKAKDGTGDKKSQDIVLNVGSYQVTLMNGIVAGGTQVFSTNYSVAARHTGSASNYVLKRNGTVINTQNNLAASTGAPSYTYSDTAAGNLNTYTLEVTQNSVTKSFTFYAIKSITPASEAMPAGLKDGVNYNTSDFTKATLVLNAPFKDFVYVAGNFNNWTPSGTYAMKKDPTSGKFWLELSGLTPENWYAFQYWVCDNTSVPINSPKVVKTADPFSNLVLSPFDDPEIVALGIYPNLPVYANIATGQEREVSVIQTGNNTFRSYNWSSASQTFVKPSIKDLVIYEVLVRDFDANRTYQDLINKIDYFKNLNINAIQLMPVMEFEGNESWGYNSVFHLASDKRYGPPAKLKEFIDLCHQNGIAVILDLALNHVFGRSPLVRMWMQDANGDGWGDAVSTTTENPYINQIATHSYGVGSDLNHFREPDNLTNTYVVETIKHWIQEYKIDGFRWDLTKGFTNQCTSGDDGCTNGYRSDRVAKLKWYADKQWENDPNSYVIFEHLGVGGSYDEEVEWANYRLAEGKGIMQWRKMTDPYANLIKGNSTDLSGVAHSTNRFVGYAESHDEERVAFKAFVEAGQTINNLTKIHQRFPAMGALLFLVPGPKMIWHFSELGYETTLFLCSNGIPNYPSQDHVPVDTIPGDCKLDTKPQPQWVNNWTADVNRAKIYTDWSKQIDLRKTENVFENGQFAWNNTSTGHPRLDVWTSNSAQPNLSYVFILTNFTDNIYNAQGGFPYTGTWYNLMDGTSLNVTNINQTVSIEPNGYRVFGNQSATLNSDKFDIKNNLTIYPNPASDTFQLSIIPKNIEVYNLTGQLIRQYQAQNTYNIEELTNGVYIVKILTENNQINTLKLVKE